MWHSHTTVKEDSIMGEKLKTNSIGRIYIHIPKHVMGWKIWIICCHYMTSILFDYVNFFLYVQAFSTQYIFFPPQKKVLLAMFHHYLLDQWQILSNLTLSLCVHLFTCQMGHLRQHMLEPLESEMIGWMVNKFHWIIVIDLFMIMLIDLQKLIISSNVTLFICIIMLLHCLLSCQIVQIYISFMDESEI